MVWDVTVMMVVGTIASIALIGGLLLALALIGFGALFILARWNTTTLAWPNPEVVTMRERTERLLPPPPTATFVNATVTTYYDGDRWRCVEYETEASAEATRAYYARAIDTMRWGDNDGQGLDAPYGDGERLVANNVKASVTPWGTGVATIPGGTSRVSLCYDYERWAPVKPRPRHTIYVYWPDASVVALQEKVERAYPPDAGWTFSGATLTRNPDGWRQLCISYETGVGELESRAYYERLTRDPTMRLEPGTPMMGKASVRARNGAVTICPL